MWYKILYIVLLIVKNGKIILLVLFLIYDCAEKNKG